jgi:hypothetical protein
MPMNCDDAIEFLPWLLNGSLEAGERNEVRGHLATCERCRAALNDTREAWTIFGQHLPGDALVALAYGEVPAGVDPAVAERHLASCAECAAELELTRTSRRLEEDDRIALFPGTSRKPETNAGRDRSWRSAAMAAGITCLLALGGWFHEFQQVGDLNQRLAQKPATEASRPTPALAPAPSRGESSVAEAQLRGQLEASKARQDEMAKTLEQATGRLAALERKAGSLVEPQLNAWSEAVTGSSDVVRGAEASEQVLPGRQLAVPILGAEGAESAHAFRDVAILDGHGKVRWSGSGLRSTDGQEYKLAIPAGFLKPGRYTIQLYANENGKRVPRESYKIRVE